MTVSAKDDYKLVLPASSDILATKDGGTVELKQLIELLKVDKKLMKIFIADSLDILETAFDEPSYLLPKYKTCDVVLVEFTSGDEGLAYLYLILFKDKKPIKKALVQGAFGNIEEADSNFTTVHFSILKNYEIKITTDSVEDGKKYPAIIDNVVLSDDCSFIDKKTLNEYIDHDE